MTTVCMIIMGVLFLIFLYGPYLLYFLAPKTFGKYFEWEIRKK